MEGKSKPRLPCSFFFCPLSPKMTIGERKMVKQKQRWTREEEEALSAGVERTKWRNMTVSGLGSTSRERVRTPIFGLDLTMNGGPSAMLEGPDPNLTESGVGSSSTNNRDGTVLGLDLNLPICSLEPSSVLPIVGCGSTIEPSPVLPLVAYGGTPEPSTSTADRIEAPEYAIPMNVENINEEEDEIGRETPEDVADVVARMIAKSEYKKQAAIKSSKKAGVLQELLEESVVMLKIVEDIHKQCKRDGVVVLNI